MDDTIKHQQIEDIFSENFSKNVAPYIKNPKTLEAIKISWDMNKVQSMNKEQLKSLILQLTTQANRQIGNYKRSGYYRSTEEYLGKSISEVDMLPTPSAYRGLISREGEIKLFSRTDIEKMSLNQLRKRLSSLRQFVSSESSVLGDTKHGMIRIMNERFKMFSHDLKEALGNRYRYAVTEELLKSEAFSKLFWKVFRKVKEYGFKYEKNQFAGFITRAIYPSVYEYGSADDDRKKDIEEEAATYITHLLDKNYEKATSKEPIEELSFGKRYRTGRKGG